MATTAPPPILPPSNSSIRDGAERYADADRQLSLDGAVDQATEKKIADDAMEIADLYFEQTTPLWEAHVRYWALYLGEKADPRSEEEKTWRANIHSPKPFRAVEAKVAVHADLMLSTSPVIQVEGVGEEDTGAQSVERLLAYQMSKNRWRKNVPMLLRAVDIQGGEFLKLHWTEQAHTFTYTPTREDYDNFRTSIMDAVRAGAPTPVPDPVTDPKGFKVWQTYINQSGAARVPDPPFAGTRQLRQYRGPKLSRLSTFDVWMDPAVDEIAEQQAIFHRSVKTPRWVRANAGPADWQMYDAAAVERALKKNSITEEYGKRFSKHRDAINQILGVSERSQRDPLWEDGQEIFECYFGGEPLGEYPFVVLLNGVIINKNPRQMPFMHGEVPIFNVRNLALPGMAHGLSDFQQLESIFHEIDAFRNLRSDGATLSMLPIIKKLASVALPEMMRSLRPGHIVPVSRMDAVDQLFKIQMPEAAYREPAEMERDVDETMSVGPNVSGQTATIGRIPATTEQGRLQQAVMRLKLSVGQVEEDFADAPRQSFALWYEKGDNEIRAKIGGKTIIIHKTELLEAIDQDYRMMGATNAINKDMLAKNLNEFGKQWGAQLTPTEIRTIMGDILETIGTRNAKKIVSDTGTKDAQMVYDAKKQMAMAQIQAQGQQQKMGAMKTPNAVGPEEMAAIEAEGGGAEQSPSGDEGGGQ
jgi:hypothetical protein